MKTIQLSKSERLVVVIKDKKIEIVIEQDYITVNGNVLHIKALLPEE